MTYRIVIPTLNAAKEWECFASAILKCVSPEHVLIIDSSSRDRTVELAHSCGFKVHIIAADAFNHGCTRQLALQLLSDVEIVVYMTQDAVLANAGSVKILLQSFENKTIAAAFGRQLPRPNASPIEAHARLFNYPALSSIRAFNDRKRLGLKTIFISNSFAAYRRAALESVGGFPRNVIFGEDMLAAANLLLEGWQLAYVADAAVYHSHSYTLAQDLRRNFDIGVAHSRNSLILRQFGSAGGEGRRFVKSEVVYLWRRDPWLVPSALVRTFLKLLGYRLGLMERNLPLGLKRRLSMNRSFWISRGRRFEATASKA